MENTPKTDALPGVESPSAGSRSDTPETDAEAIRTQDKGSRLNVPIGFARKMERDRDRLRNRCERLEQKLRDIVAHDGPGFPKGTCAKIAETALSENSDSTT